MVRSGSALNDPALAELLRVNNFKQALKNVEKKLKKQPRDVELLILRADVLSKIGDHEASFTVCRDLSVQTPPIQDADLLNKIHQISCQLPSASFPLLDVHLENLWQNAIKVQTKSVEKFVLSHDWATNAIKNAQWGQMVKAAAILYRLKDGAYTDAQKYYWWQIVGHWLTKTSSHVSDERLRGLGQQMAVRMLEKALEQTYRDTTLVNRSGVTKHSHLDLLRLIFVDSDRYASLLSAIDEKRLGDYSPQAIDEWGANQARFDVYEHRQNDQKTWSLARDIIRSAMSLDVKWRLDDWNCYRHLIKCGRGETLQVTKALLNEIISADRGARSPQYSLLQIYSSEAKNAPVQRSNGDDCIATQDLLKHLKRVFRLFGDQAGCLGNIEGIIRDLTNQQSQQLRTSIHAISQEIPQSLFSSKKEQLQWVGREINALATDFFIEVSHASSETRKRGLGRSEYLEKLINQSLELYQLSYHHITRSAPTDTGPGDSACILAARALVQLKYINDNDNDVYIFQAACILTHLLEHSPYNFDARLMLINLLSYLGLPTIAVKQYKELRVKEILIESCCPLAISRISSLLPFPSTAVDPEELMRESLRFYGNALQQISKHQATALDNENYTPCIELDSFLDRIKNSPTRRMLIWERRRIARLRGVALNEDDWQIEKHPSLNFQNGEDEIGNSWMKTMQDKILLNEPPPMSAEYIGNLEAVHRSLESTSNASALNPPDSNTMKALKISYDRKDTAYLTRSERTSTDIAISIARIQNSSSTPSQTNIETLLQELQTLQMKLSSHLSYALGPISPHKRKTTHWQILHDLTISFEVLSASHKLTTQLYVRMKSLQNSKLANKVGSLQHFCQEEVKNCVDAATKVLAQVKESTNGEGLFKTVFGTHKGGTEEEEGRKQWKVGEIVSNSVGEVNAKRIMREFADAGIEALELLLGGLKRL